MKYFWTEQERKEHHTTCCMEFQKGKFDGENWKESPICLHGDAFDDLGFNEIFNKAVNNFDYYGITEINHGDWLKIKALAEKTGGELSEAMKELIPWAEENFKAEEVFTLLGI